MIHIFSGYLDNFFQKYSFSVCKYDATQDLYQDYVREFVREQNIIATTACNSITLVRYKNETTSVLYEVDPFTKFFIFSKPGNSCFYEYYLHYQWLLLENDIVH